MLLSFSRFLFARADSLGRIILPAKEEFYFLKKFSKEFFFSKIFFIGIVCFLLILFSDFLVRNSLEDGKIYHIFNFFYLTNIYHPTPKLSYLFLILVLLRILFFFRFKTYWRDNIFFNLGFGLLFGGILGRIKNLGGTIDWIGIGAYVFSLFDLFFTLGVLFLFIGVLICPKRK